MHDIEPFYSWRHLYTSENDTHSPFEGREYSDIYFSHTVYNYYIHPQWDEFGSNTLYLKILFVDYEKSVAIIELIGEWNDCLYNDIMFLKRNIIELMLSKGIQNYILIGENVLNFHYSDELYYEEWHEDSDGGYIVCIGFLPHVITEFKNAGIDRFLVFNDDILDIDWRTYTPDHLIEKVESLI
ncbi:MAG: hypothetical protein JXR53_05405 [Bacteroidales bacterium]|jgi:hypothetical protein|nr:hypothetical protein [Bacteroidales bacterium]